VPLYRSSWLEVPERAMDFQFKRGHKKPRTENRRRSLFRTPPKLREQQAGESTAADEPAPQHAPGPMSTRANTCAHMRLLFAVRCAPQMTKGCVRHGLCRRADFANLGSVASEALGKRQRSECIETDDSLRSAALPDDLRLSKAIGEAVESGLKMIPVRARSATPACTLLPDHADGCLQVKPGEGFALDAGAPSQLTHTATND
jgi:hypothetical protein